MQKNLQVGLLKDKNRLNELFDILKFVLECQYGNRL